MSRWIQTGALALLLAGLAAPVVAQDASLVARYFRSSVVEADWPEAVMCGDSFTVDVTMMNTATAKWSEAGFHKLGATKGEDEAFRTDGEKFKMPDGAEVPFRGQHTFTLELTAPDKAGSYETEWSMMIKGAPYGEPIGQTINVYCKDSKLARAKFPEEVACGESFTAEVRMKNTGKSAWTEESFYKLGPVLKTEEVFRPDGHKFKMPDLSEVEVGGIYAFELDLTAPDERGVYQTRWTMMDSGKPFGEEVSRDIKVVCKRRKSSN